YHVMAQQVLGLTLQRRALTREDVTEHLAAFEPFVAPEHELILGHMLEREFLIQDGELLMVGPAAERRYGGMHFRDVMAVFTAAPQLTVLHGRSEIGQIDPMVLRTPQEGTRTLTPAGRGRRVTSVDLDPQRVQVDTGDN